MKNTIDLNTSRKELERVTKEQEKQIKDVYSGSLKTVRKQLKSLEGIETSTASLQRARLSKLEKDLSNELKRASKQVEGIVKDSMLKVSGAVVQDSAEWLKTIGLGVKGAYAYVPKDVVSSLVTGKVYSGDWTLSKAIWSADKKAQSDIQKIVAEGIAQNKSSFDIAKDLESYVDPRKAKDWAWNKVYPGTSARIDYNAQRLARTMTSHAYQQSLVMTVKDNPFVTGIEWRSAHAAGRTCPICEERDGEIFDKDKLPLDHPNGLCSWIPTIPDSYDDIADRIDRWDPNNNDPEMDKFAESIGYKSPMAKKTVEKGKTRTKTTDQKEALKPKQKMPDTNTVSNAKADAESLTEAAQKIVDSIVPDNKLLTNHLKDKVTKQQLASIEEKYKKLPSSLRKIDKYMNDKGMKYRLKGIEFSETGYYAPSEKVIALDLKKDAERVLNGAEKARYKTLFHEYGHYIDDIGGISDSSWEELIASVKADYSLIESEKAFRTFRLDCINNINKSDALQDIVSGLTLNERRIVFGHSTDYWKYSSRAGTDHRITMEVIAGVTSVHIDEEAFILYKRYFPKTLETYYKLLDETLINLVKADL